MLQHTPPCPNTVCTKLNVSYYSVYTESTIYLTTVCTHNTSYYSVHTQNTTYATTVPTHSTQDIQLQNTTQHTVSCSRVQRAGAARPSVLRGVRERDARAAVDEALQVWGRVWVLRRVRVPQGGCCDVCGCCDVFGCLKVGAPRWVLRRVWLLGRVWVRCDVFGYPKAKYNSLHNDPKVSKQNVIFLSCKSIF